MCGLVKSWSNVGRLTFDQHSNTLLSCILVIHSECSTTLQVQGQAWEGEEKGSWGLGEEEQACYLGLVPWGGPAQLDSSALGHYNQKNRMESMHTSKIYNKGYYIMYIVSHLTRTILLLDTLQFRQGVL